MDSSESTEDSNYAEQRERFVRAIERFPDSLLLRLNFGQFLLRHKQWAAAIDQFRAVIQMDPNNVWAHIGIGLCYFDQAKFQQALDSFRRAAEIRPDNLAAQMNLAACLERLGRSDEATRRWQKILEQVDDSRLRRKIEFWLATRQGSPALQFRTPSDQPTP